MKIHLKKITHILFCLIVLTAIGCESEQVKITDSTVVETKKEQELMVPLPRGTASRTDKSPDTAIQSNEPAATPLPTISSASEEDDGYMKLEWDYLLPADYRPDAILSKYMDQLAELDDSSPKAMEIYGKIQAELENAPINNDLDGKKVKLAGFIAPLENSGGNVSEFLLVPYYGACIHVPPPPINQTVLVKTRPGDAIKAEQTSLPFWIKGTLTTEGESTEIGAAGYSILEAETEEFKDY